MNTPTPSPKIEQLLFKLNSLNLDLTRNMMRLTKRLAHLETESETESQDECLVLSEAHYNIVDRKRQKREHLASWKINIILNEKIDAPIEYERLH